MVCPGKCPTCTCWVEFWSVHCAVCPPFPYPVWWLCTRRPQLFLPSVLSVFASSILTVCRCINVEQGRHPPRPLSILSESPVDGVDLDHVTPVCLCVGEFNRVVEGLFVFSTRSRFLLLIPRLLLLLCSVVFGSEMFKFFILLWRLGIPLNPKTLTL